MDQHTDGEQPKLEELSYNELKEYIRTKGYDINLTQSADKLLQAVESIEMGEPEPQAKPYEVTGNPPKHDSLSEWLDSRLISTALSYLNMLRSLAHSSFIGWRSSSLTNKARPSGNPTQTASFVISSGQA